jgi:uncharacterized membrane protein
MAKVYYVGDWAVLLGPIFAETPFNYAVKGTDVYDYGRWLKEALESTGRHQVTSVPAWEFYRLGPGRYEEILAEYDVLVFSDVEAKLFQLDPSFFDRSKFGPRPLTFPDRVRLTVEALHAGTGVMFLGGWLSFNGEMGKGGWGRTRLAEVVPVECLEHEDLRETTEGFAAEACIEDHPILAGIDLASMPPILGYNITRPRDGCEVVATWRPYGDPMLAVGRFGSGRVLAYTSDPAPHWGCNFVYWDQYARFWTNACDWVTGGRR